MSKVCCTCKTEHPIESFHVNTKRSDGRSPVCKLCKSAADKRYRDANLEKRREQDRKYGASHKEEAKQRAKDWYESNPERAKASRKEYYEKNYAQLKAAQKKWNEANQEKMKQYMNDYVKNRYKTDINYRLKSIINKRIRDGVRQKTKPTIEYLGCSLPYFMDWIECQFTPEMSWDNLGTYWQMDHVKPCASFDFSKEEDIYECYHWSNLQPLSSVENIVKKDKVLPDLIASHKELARQYELQNRVV